MTDQLHVVLGGSGGAGRAMVAELVRRGRKVRSVSRTPGEASPSVETVAADLADPAATAAAVRDASVVYQCVSPTYHRWPIEFPPIQANVIAAVERSGAKLVMADNLYMYGPAGGALREDTPHRATDTKGVLRARMADELLEAHAAGRFRVAIGRSSDYYGPGRVNSAVGELVFGAVAAGKQPRWLADLDQPHTLSYLPDTAAGLVTLGERAEADGRVWHLPVQPPMTGRQWVERIGSVVDRPVKLGRISRPMLVMAGLFSPRIRELRGTLYQWERPWVMDDSAFRSSFNAVPTPLDAAIEAALASRG